MKKILFLSIFLFAHLFFHAAIPIAPHPVWVKPQLLVTSQSITTSDANNRYYYMLMDEQTNVVKKNQYSHSANKIILEAGVQNSSELNFSYNPVYEKFVFHSLKCIIRGNVLIKHSKETFIN